MKVSELVIRRTYSHGAIGWAKECWVTDGKGMWQFDLGYVPYILWVDGDSISNIKIGSLLELACWLEDKTNYTGELP